MNTVHKITTQEEHLIHHLINQQHYDVIDVITQKSRLKYEIKLF